MATATHGFVSQLTRQTTTSGTPVDVTGAVITSGNFVAGKKYLLVVTAQADSSDVQAYCECRMAHGGTTFPNTIQREEPDTITSRIQYFWFGVWEAVASEDVTLQLAVQTTATAGVDTIGMFWLKLSDDFEENVDWFFNEVAASTTLTGTESSTNNASITFTPANANDKWLILAISRTTTVSVTISYQSRLLRTGEATETVSEVIDEAEEPSGFKVLPHMAVLQLGAVSNTFTEKSLVSTTGTTETRDRSAIFALNLSKFAAASIARTATLTDLSATDYATQLETVSLTPPVAGDVWSLGYFVHDGTAAGIFAKHRLQIDNADDPADQTTDAYAVGELHDARDQLAHVIQTVASLSAAAHTFDLDASTETATAGRGGLYRSLFAVTMELVGVPNTAGMSRLHNGVVAITAAGKGGVLVT